MIEMTKAKQEKNLAVHWVLPKFKCKKNFHGFYFICFENTAIAQSIHRQLEDHILIKVAVVAIHSVYHWTPTSSHQLVETSSLEL